jgi:hypothetical protein
LAAAAGIFSVTAPTAAQDAKVDLNTVFRCVNMEQARCDEGRELVLAQCTTCHTYGPIVLQQFDDGGWRGLLDRHRVYARSLTDEQFEKIQAYLAANFNPTLDPPEVPPEILKAWTDY